MEEPGRNADNAGNAGIAEIAENEKGSPPVERCLASSIVRLSRTMEDRCEADSVGTVEEARSAERS
jgi:hypothetical protein